MIWEIGGLEGGGLSWFDEIAELPGCIINA